MKKIFAVLLMILWSTASMANINQPQSVKDSLDHFVTSWNEGNIDNAMQIYKKSADTQLISDQVVKGYTQIVKFWKDSYPTKDDMGTMNFSNIEVKQLSNRYAMAVGKWTLSNVKNPTGGIFTVLFEKTEHDHWKAVMDHTTGL